MAGLVDNIPKVRSRKALREAENHCTRCPLFRHATQAVPGEGPAHAQIMMIGEQPGDQEDLAGKPFVGPAGRLLDKAIADANLERDAIFVTNAVKHFKFEQRGKRRLHKRPNAYEIDRCKVWFEQERAIVQPRLIIALGATAARSLTGRPTTISKIRGRLFALDDATQGLITIHPSFLLRMPDQTQKKREYGRFIADLKIAHDIPGL